MGGCLYGSRRIARVAQRNSGVLNCISQNCQKFSDFVFDMPVIGDWRKIFPVLIELSVHFDHQGLDSGISEICGWDHAAGIRIIQGNRIF